MNRIFVDLEMHPIATVHNEQRAIWKTETIEIGAVMLDEQLQEIGSFKEYVKPDYSEKVYSKYQKLTGITTEMLAEADGFENVMARFVDWCGTDYVIYSWSDSDIWQMIEECRMKGIHCGQGLRYMFNHWRDFQSEFGEMLQMERQISLKDAVMMGGLDFDGKAHDGLTDARNTANLFVQTSDVGSEDFKKLVRSIREFRKPCTFSMMEVFDFSTITLAQ